MPVSPPDTGLLLVSGPQSSPSQLFSPKLPVSVDIPEIGICNTGTKFMLVGTVPNKTKSDLEIIVPSFNYTEAIHIQIR